MNASIRDVPSETPERIAADLELDVANKSFRSGLLHELLAGLRRIENGQLLGVTTTDPSVGAELEKWARLTDNSIVGSTSEPKGTRFVLRKGKAEPEAAERPLETRLWLYTNFHCNLACDYCCVRSSPHAPKRELGLPTIQRIVREARPLGVKELFVTGGEPFLLEDIGEILRTCAAAFPTTVLTNGMLLRGRRRAALEQLPRDRLTLQISLDSPTPELHDRHRGPGSWHRAMEGIEIAQGLGFRVRLAATVADDAAAKAFEQFLDARGIAESDRVIRRIARRGLAEAGLALARADVVPEVTITADGVSWHPVGADDRDFFVSKEIFPLEAAFRAVRRALEHERALHTTLMEVFHCA